MNNHAIILPVLIPLIAAMFCVLLPTGNRAGRRVVGGLALLGTTAIALGLVALADTGAISVYRFGDWPIPYGIIFLVDRLSALMVLLCSAVALLSFLHASVGPDRRSDHFPTLFLTLVAGVNGAFLTGDAFNLFVFFEILLISAYILVVHGRAAARAQAGMQYVFLNLVGSALFLLAVGLLYGLTGSLNMAHMAVRVTELPPGDAALLRVGATLMMVVFAIKSALFPVWSWLPRAYAASSASVAAVFAIMTKVGIYALIRYSGLIFGVGRGPVEDLVKPWLLPLALITTVVAVIAAVAAKRLNGLASWLLIASVGTILVGPGLFQNDGLSAGLYYLLHSTLAMAALFLVADLIERQRGPEHGDSLVPGPALPQHRLVGVLFLLTMIAVAGLPPLSGFLGKALLLSSATEHPAGPVIFAVVLLSAFASLVAISRAGSVLFWKTTDTPAPESTAIGWRALPVSLLLLCILGLTLGAGPVVEYLDRTAAQVRDPAILIEAVLGETP